MGGRQGARRAGCGSRMVRPHSKLAEWIDNPRGEACIYCQHGAYCDATCLRQMPDRAVRVTHRVRCDRRAIRRVVRRAPTPRRAVPPPINPVPWAPVSTPRTWPPLQRARRAEDGIGPRVLRYLCWLDWRVRSTLQFCSLILRVEIKAGKQDAVRRSAVGTWRW